MAKNYIISKIRQKPTIIVLAESIIIKNKRSLTFIMKNEFVDFGQNTDQIIEQFGKKRKKFSYTSKKGKLIELKCSYRKMMDMAIATDINIIKRKPAKV